MTAVGDRIATYAVDRDYKKVVVYPDDDWGSWDVVVWLHHSGPVAG